MPQSSIAHCTQSLELVVDLLSGVGDLEHQAKAVAHVRSDPAGALPCKYGLDKTTNIFERKVYSPRLRAGARGVWCPAKLTKSPYPGTIGQKTAGVVRHTAVATLR